MYSKHPVFEEPADRNVRIWHYQRFDRFEEVVNRQALFFKRLDKLNEKFEGSYTAGNKAYHERIWEERARLLSANSIPEQVIKRIRESDDAFSRATRRCVVVSCWHMSDHESAAMWRIYSDQKKGIAIQSTFSRLVKSIEQNVEDSICIGKVKYIDYSKETFPIDNFFFPYVYKRKSFEFEQELRAAILKFPINDRSELDLSMEPYEGQEGKFASVDLDALIENIYISPEAGSDLLGKTKLVLKKHELNKEVIMSDLSRDPLF